MKISKRKLKAEAKKQVSLILVVILVAAIVVPVLFSIISIL